MGGFVDDKAVLSLREIEQLVQNGEIEYPIVSQQEIEDRSKGDAVTKALVVSQTAFPTPVCSSGKPTFGADRARAHDGSFCGVKHRHVRALVG
jgi:hypothetical protein